MGQETTDATLVARAKTGDRAAFDMLCRRHARKIYALVLRMLRGDREEAEDLTQDVMLSAYKSLASFREESQFSTWLHRIAVNKTLNHLQKKKLPVRSLSESRPGAEDERELELPDPGEGPEQNLQRQELQAAVGEAINRLSDSLRQVFVLRELHHLSHEEIGEMLGANPQAIRVRLHRAKKELVRELRVYLEAAR